MNCDDLLFADLPVLSAVQDDKALLSKKERLYSLAACGKTRQYLGTELSIEQIQQMSPQDIEKYHCRYEAQLGSRMVRSVGQTALTLYAKLVSLFAPIDSEQDLTYDLTQDPVVTKSLESLACDLYYRFGTLLAPLIMGLITVNHIDFNYIKNERTRESGESEPPEQSTSAGELTESTSAGDPTESTTGE